MITISILPEGNNTYLALAGDKESTGRTAGKALDALRSQLADEESHTLAIVQDYKPDEFFTAPQQERIAALMRKREAGELVPEEEKELESLIEAELYGAGERASAIASAAKAESDPILVILEAEQAIHEWMRDLEGTDRQKILTLWSNGMSPKEIAEALNIKASTVSVRLKELQKRLITIILRTDRESRLLR